MKSIVNDLDKHTIDIYLNIIPSSSFYNVLGL